MWFTSSDFWRITAAWLIHLTSIFKIFSNHERGFVPEVGKASSLVKLSLHSTAIQTAKASLNLYKKYWLMFKWGLLQVMHELGPPFRPVSNLYWVICWEVPPAQPNPQCLWQNIFSGNHPLRHYIVCLKKIMHQLQSEYAKN